MIKAPLLDAVPSPPTRMVDPPVCTATDPDLNSIKPEFPLEPLPAHREMKPARPPLEFPDPTDKVPLFPELDDPELNESLPAEPRVPLFTDVR